MAFPSSGLIVPGELEAHTMVNCPDGRCEIYFVKCLRIINETYDFQ